MSKQPLFLLLDGHSTHYQPDLIRYARNNDVVMLCLSPHTTHETRPLDTGVFKPLKTQWSKVCHNFTQKNSGRVITKFTFNSLFSQAWLLAVTPANVMAGFKPSGVYPLNRQSKLPHLLLPAQQKTALIQKKMKAKNLESHLIVKPISAQSKNYSRNVLLKVMILNR